MKAQVYESEGDVMLGGLFPVHATRNDSSCAALQEFGIQQMEAMVFAVESVNSNPHLLPNTTLAFRIRDSCSNPTHALNQAFHYVQNSNGSCEMYNNRVAVSGVVGPHFSRTSIDVANLLRLYKIPQISYISTADLLSDKSRFDYFFRTVPPDRLQARAIADIIARFEWTFVMILYSDDPYGRGGINALTRELKERNVCVAITLPLSVTATHTDYTNALQAMSNEWVRNSSVAVLFGHLNAAIGIMQALADGNFELKDLTWIGTDAWGDSLPSEYHSIARGMLSVIPRAEESLEFDRYFTSLHPSNHSNPWFQEFWESRFNCSLSENTCRLDNEFIVLSAAEHRQISEATLVIDAVLAFAHALDSIIKTSCTPADTLCPGVMVNQLTGKAVNGELLREHLYEISFNGTSSNLVTFNREGDEQGAYSVKNLQMTTEGEYSFEVVGLWHYLTSLEVDAERIEWVSNGTVPPESFCSERCEGGEGRIFMGKVECCWSCTPCQGKGYSDGMTECQECNETHMPNLERTGCVPIPVTYLRWYDGWAIAMMAVAACGLIVTLCVCIIFAIHFRHSVIKASSREITAILLLGLILCYLTPLPFVAAPSGVVCAIRRFVVGFSFAVCYSALLVKTNRIHRIFNQQSLNPSKPPPLVSPLSQVLLTVLFISIQVIMAAIWLAIEHPSTRIVYFERSAELRCGESPIIGLPITLSYNFILLLLSTYFAFCARKVPENFNEARYINITAYTLVVIWLAFGPTYFATAKLGAVFQTCSLSLAIILSATTTLVCLFIPKLVLLVTQVREKKRETESHISAVNMNTARTSL